MVALTLAYDADALPDANSCGWVVPSIWRSDDGLVAIRFVCSGCQQAGQWAIGPPSALVALTAQARALGPHGAM
jgi:hypothetical protein